MNTPFQPVPFQPAPSAEHPSLDYPAAHSMDTLWFAVDENGEIGRMDSCENGSAPMLEGMEPSTSADRLKPFYYKSYDYNEQYRAVEIFLFEHDGEETDEADWVDDEDREKVFHAYATDYASNTDSLYYWKRSPEKPLTIHDLPGRLRNPKYLLELKDYDFASREPIDPHEYVRRCYSGSRVEHIYPVGWHHTFFPILDEDGSWSPKYFEECYKESYKFDGRGFFAVDDEDCLALFRTDRFGALPLEPGKTEALADGITIWQQLICPGPPDVPHPAWATARPQAEQAWRDQGPLHWLEYPFGEASPRLFGLYHYDASWHHPMPYLRIGVPQAPLRLGDLAGDLQDRMKPVRLPGVRFAQAQRVQPFEILPCISMSKNIHDIAYGWQYPQVWIDAALERVHPCHELAVFDGDQELLLRRARRHVRRVESLARQR